MRVYIASRLENAPKVQMLRDHLRRVGISVTYDWTTHGSVQTAGEARMREVAEAELEGVATADAVIVVWPGGRGAHVELGAALALGKPVYLCVPEVAPWEGEAPSVAPCSFYFALSVQIVRPSTYVESRRITDESRIHCAWRNLCRYHGAGP